MDSSSASLLMTLKPPSSSFNYYYYYHHHHHHPLFHSNNNNNSSFYFFNITKPTSCSQSHTTDSNSQTNLPSLFPLFPSRTTHNNKKSSRRDDCCYDELQQNGGFGVALLISSITTNAVAAKVIRISPLVATLASNPTFVSGLAAWFVAQSIKVLLNFLFQRGKWDFTLFFSSGGMPSSHSALCAALTTSVALCHGLSDSLFPVCLGFTSIVMYDAIGVRRHAGMQARVLNMIVADLFQGHPISERKLKEVVGHTPSQVFAGALLGFLIACQVGAA